jgi:pimeloyl-ACP methyl ester carboxylesterase
MAPRIQYVTTSDGVRIAYWTLGSGQPLIHAPHSVSNLELEWQIPEVRDWYEQLAARFLLVRYDGRGTGVSQRSVEMPGPTASLPDLEAVVERIGQENLLIFCPGPNSENATKLVRSHPGTVAGLVFCGGAGGFIPASKSLQQGFLGLA